MSYVTLTAAERKKKLCSKPICVVRSFINKIGEVENTMDVENVFLWRTLFQNIFMCIILPFSPPLGCTFWILTYKLLEYNILCFVIMYYLYLFRIMIFMYKICNSKFYVSCYLNLVVFIFFKTFSNILYVDIHMWRVI